MASTAYSVSDSQKAHNVTRFPVKDINNGKNENYDHDNYNNNNYRVRARTRETDAVFQDAFQHVRDAYADVFGREIPRFVYNEMLDMMDELSIKADMIVAVIEYTACAPRPSWAYARAVLYRCCMQKGIVTGSGFRRDLRGRGRDQNPNQAMREEDEDIF